MVNIYLCVTLYHLYVSLVMIESRGDKDKSVILLNANDEQIYQNFCKYEKILKKHGYTVDIHMRSKVKNLVGLEAAEGKKQFHRVESQLGYKIGGNFNLYNFAWNCQYAYSIATYYIKKCSRLYIVEEGAQTAYVPAQPGYKILVKKLTGNVVDFYKLDKLEGIYLQKPEIFPSQWDKKKKLCLSELEASLSGESRRELLKVFLGDLYARLETYDFSHMGIIYTQALSEDKYITEQQKIDYYSQMVAFYGKYAAPIVKLHPRDKTQYPFAKDVLVLPYNIPSEVLALMGIEFRYAVAICSSAVLTTNARSKLNLNENFNHDQIFRLEPLENASEG